MSKRALRNLIISISTIMTLIVIALCIKIAASINKDDLGKQDAATLKNTFGRMTIEDTNMTSDEINSNYKVTKDMIVKMAYDLTGIAKECKSIHTQFAIMTNEDILSAVIPQKTKDNNPQINEKGYLYRVPVWIISYEGLCICRRGNNTLTEMNKVIDATTGEEIYGYNYR